MKYSEEHLNFLKKLRREKIIVGVSQFIIIFGVLLLWELLAYFNVINTFLYSSPSRIFSTIINLGYEELFKHLFITLYEVVISFILSSVIGIVIAAVLWNSPILSRIVEPFITVINSLPKVALGPLFIIWIGASVKSIIFMSLTISLFTTILNVYQGFISVCDDYIVMFKSFGARRIDVFMKIIIPSNIPNIISTLKINISLSLIGVIMGELLVSKMGMGYLIMYGSQVFQLDLVITSIIILGIISYLLYFSLNIVDSLLKRKIKN